MNLENIDIEKYTNMVIEAIINYTPKVILVFLTLFVGLFLIKHITKVLDKGFKHQKLDRSLTGFLDSLVSIILKIILFITVAGMVGVQMTSFIAILGAAGLAIGLALQGSLSNFAGGVLILIFKPFKVGDFIESQGKMGYVQKIEIFSTILKDATNKIHIIPNGNLSNDTIDNWSKEKMRRIDITLGIGYNDDIDEARKLILEIASKNKTILDKPSPVVFVGNLGESSVDMVLRCWVKPNDIFGISADVYEAAKKTFDAKGISIPFPQRDIHLHQVQ